ncbi:S4 domain-containing protein [Glycocaulis abyssi]|uniref:S4 domain-containing protein n=1 Tax=Glycocaulis abyssi TaxID=1433403 RepID=A0ABV9NFJ7_9PROT
MTGPASGDEAPERIRIDVWLFRARFLKSRALAADLVNRGHVRLERGGQIVKIAKAAHLIQPGDILTLPLRPAPARIEICATGHRRGPPAEARTLYRALDIAGP